MSVGGGAAPSISLQRGCAAVPSRPPSATPLQPPAKGAGEGAGEAAASAEHRSRRRSAPPPPPRFPPFGLPVSLSLSSLPSPPSTPPPLSHPPFPPPKHQVAIIHCSCAAVPPRPPQAMLLQPPAKGAREGAGEAAASAGERRAAGRGTSAGTLLPPKHQVAIIHCRHLYRDPTPTPLGESLRTFGYCVIEKKIVIIDKL